MYILVQEQRAQRGAGSSRRGNPHVSPSLAESMLRKDVATSGVGVKLQGVKACHPQDPSRGCKSGSPCEESRLKWLGCVVGE